MKENIKKIVPEKLIQVYRNARTTIVLKTSYKNDRKRFSQSSFNQSNKQTFENLNAKISFHAHAIEKGLSNVKLRYGFGEIAFHELFNAMDEYVEKDYPIRNERFQSAISTIESYISIHDLEGYNIQNIKFKLKGYKKTFISESNDGGVTEYNKKEILAYKETSFKSLAQHRVSVRDFSEEPVELETIKEAIDLSTKAPSVCNRQPWKVFVIRDNEMKINVLKNQGGLNGYGNNLDTLLMITVDNQYLSGPHERNQSFIDGGLFSMNLIYSLEFKGLATCFLNASLSIRNEKNIRRLLNVSKSDDIILFIAVGNYPDKFKVPKSPRINYEDIIVFK